MLKQSLKDIFHQLKEFQPVGIDGISMDKFKTILEDELDIMSKKIENETYNFGYYKQKLIAKTADSSREISIPTIRDKIVINYLYKYIKNAFIEELKLIPSMHQMIYDIKLNKPNFEYFIKTDIEKFFPSIDHTILFGILEETIKDKKILSLIKKAISQTTLSTGTPSKEREKYTNNQGVPQGLSISGLLADLYLVNLSKKYQNNTSIQFYKYVDDVLIFCNQEDLEKLKTQIIEDFKNLNLNIHSFEDNSKSVINKTTQTFDFLGYTFNNEKTSVRNRSTQKMFQNLSKIFTMYKNDRFVNKTSFYRNLNIKITGCIYQDKQYGWIHFFAFMDDYTLLYKLDRFVKINCKKIGIPYDEKVKKFSRAIFELKDEVSSYIPNIGSLSIQKQNRIIYELEEDVTFY